MPVIKTRSRQNILDIAIQEQGDVATVFGLALNNGFSLTYDPDIGTEVKTGAATNKEIVKFFNTELKNPASADAVVINKGVGYWRVGIDFKVS